MIIPARDEEGAIAGVVRGFLAATAADGSSLLDEVVVADNGSRDGTAEVARHAGATVVSEPIAGYGRACLAGIAYLSGRTGGPPEIVVFADGDGSNDAADLDALLSPLRAGPVELVIGARGPHADLGSLTVPQRFGNILACRLMGALFGARFTDLGPFRAITWGALSRLAMEDRDYGWTVEMQVKAAKQRLPAQEVAVANHCRVAGRSKVSGTIRGVVSAGTKIIYTILRHR